VKRVIIGLAAVLILSAVALAAIACGDEEPAPAGTTAATEEAAEEEAGPATLDIVATAVEAGDFATLTSALTEAGLIDTLKGEGPFTVFAPTDAAFERLPEGTLEALLEDPTGQLTEILTYHVVPGRVTASDLRDGLAAMSAQGSVLVVTVDDDDTLMVDGARITTTDIEASNGVIHVIDAVLFPPPQGGT